MTGDEYREAHRLPATGALAADGVRAAIGDRMRQVIADDPHALDHLNVSREFLDAIRSPERVSETRAYESVRVRQLRGQRYAVQVMAGRRRAIQDEALRRRGYDGLDGAIRATAHLSVREAAAATGLGQTTIRRWRTRLNA